MAILNGGINVNISCKGGPPEEKLVIYRGSTPTIILSFENEELNFADITACRVIMANDDNRNKKIFNSPTIDREEETISVELSQQDTLGFDYGNLNLQAKIKLQNERVVIGDGPVMLVKKTLDETVI